MPLRCFPVRWTLILTRCRLDQQVAHRLLAFLRRLVMSYRPYLNLVDIWRR